MHFNKTTTNLALGLLMAIMIASVPAMAQTEVAVNFQWTAPTTGSPVDHYVVQQSVNGGEWVLVGTASSTSFTLSATVGDSHSIRVAGVDSEQRQGYFSEASEPFTAELGIPGQPGQPVVF